MPRMICMYGIAKNRFYYIGTAVLLYCCRALMAAVRYFEVCHSRITVLIGSKHPIELYCCTSRYPWMRLGTSLAHRNATRTWQPLIRSMRTTYDTSDASERVHPHHALSYPCVQEHRETRPCSYEYAHVHTSPPEPCSRQPQTEMQIAAPPPPHHTPSPTQLASYQ